ncbi:hypothetical protein ASPWEDRAFT_45368 [Aspergillus wentii DTO 134E9]|uniref:Uncharacterized protein n=1 Tax=Aspergillus wentii DTO 134E9 TaxID=1073089 RepID=A0A1L9R986_ASPWE|nr:uncharacterized protein ASPWEDRAFT_45368 [Aspergillus wentii DTO 134E9]OJJ31443.1 hypothetical protein ASPWEDRAFT_45368 [Aspergillus wentii DTO 134E9]
MSDTSHFTYIPAGALASRRIIEESSYRTTPAQSSQDKTPPCGEATYKHSIGEKETEAINAALRNRTNAEALEDQAAGGCESSPDENNDQLHMKVKGGEGKAKGFPMCKMQDFRTEGVHNIYNSRPRTA